MLVALEEAAPGHALLEGRAQLLRPRVLALAPRGGDLPVALHEALPVLSVWSTYDSTGEGCLFFKLRTYLPIFPPKYFSQHNFLNFLQNS